MKEVNSLLWSYLKQFFPLLEQKINENSDLMHKITVPLRLFQKTKAACEILFSKKWDFTIFYKANPNFMK
jgi:hypothetical protein